MADHSLAATTERGVVARLGAKPRTPGSRGLPKPEVAEAVVSLRGLEGDYNVYREAEKGGDPAMALLLMPVETLHDLQREGWPVAPGDLGENITVAGIPYDRLAPPQRLRIGEVLVESTKVCDPCDNLYLLPYVGRARGPEFLRAMLGRRGWYARVVRPGTVRKGDPVVLAGPGD